MTEKTKKPILVTGIHRSGSTFVGKMLCLNKNIGYIQEPFNKDYGLKLFNINFKYITDQNIDHKIKQTLDDLINLRKAEYRIPSITVNHNSVKNRRELFNELRENFTINYLKEFCFRFLFKSSAQISFYSTKYNPAIDRILIKDPLACFASQFLHSTYNMDIVILVRHPLSFAGSLKRLTWDFDFNTFLNQPQLMDDHLEPYRDDMIRINNMSASIVEKACLIWNCVYTVLSKFITSNSSFIVYRHEDISQQPRESFETLYKKLGLNYNTDIAKKIQEYTSTQNSVQAEQNQVHQLNRDSANLIYNWEKILSNKEINYIKENTKQVAAHFYDPNFFSKV